MKLTKIPYIHNHITYTDSEKDTLNQAVAIITQLRKDNTCDVATQDNYLNDLCNTTIKGLRELLDDYSNEIVMNTNVPSKQE